MVFTAVSVLVSVYTAFIFILAHMIKSNEGWSIFEPQENSSEFPVAAGTYLTDCLLEENGTPRFLLAVFLFFLAVTALVMVTSEICASTIRAPTTTIVQQSCSPGFVSNPIPFLSLHICVLLIVFKQILLRFFFNVTVPVDPRDKRQNAETCRVATATKVGDNDRGEKLFMKKHRRSSDHLYCSCLDDR